MHHLRLGRLQTFERWRGGNGDMRPGRSQQVVVAVPVLYSEFRGHTEDNISRHVECAFRFCAY